MSLPRRARFATTLTSLLIAACAAGAPRDTSSPNFKLVNATYDSVMAVAVAPSGSQDFHPVDLGHPLQGGLTAVTVRLPPGDCLRDLRVTFRTGRVESFQAVDICRVHGMRLDIR